ncbi:DUF4468 domain-containing protein [Priestia flexa]|uniref:DUF4468 domain-containing protein n=1 Tax=Priestia flexa TaxID=86664 RepID=UPI000473594F|nr:DUF4468 domain-containing protein [Priestia flexa]
MRKTQIYNDMYEWMDYEFNQLFKGARFRLLNDEGDLIYINGQSEFIATSDSYYSDESSCWLIDTN